MAAALARRLGRGGRRALCGEGVGAKAAEKYIVGRGVLGVMLQAGALEGLHRDSTRLARRAERVAEHGQAALRGPEGGDPPVYAVGDPSDAGKAARRGDHRWWKEREQEEEDEGGCWFQLAVHG